jgi:hypothetical protein
MSERRHGAALEYAHAAATQLARATLLARADEVIE